MSKMRCITIVVSLRDGFASQIHGNGGDSAGGPTPDRDGAKRYLEEFIEDTGWLPDQSAAFAGAIRHSRYSLVRTIMLRLSLLTKGMPEAGDHEYTDWHAVNAFVETFARRLETPKR